MVEEDRPLGDVVEERFQPVVEHRQPVLDAGIAPAGGDRFVERIIAGHGAERAPIGATETGDRLRREQDLADRYEMQRAGRVRAALRHGIEPVRGLDDIAKEVEPHRALGIGREDIDDTAAHGVVAGLHHRAGAHEAVAFQVAQQRLDIERRAGRQRKGGIGQHRAGWHPLDRRIDRGEYHLGPRRAVAQQADEAGEAPACDISAGRDPVVGQAIPGRNRDLRAVGIVEGEHRGKPREPRIVAGDVEDRRGLSLCQP